MEHCGVILCIAHDTVCSRWLLPSLAIEQAAGAGSAASVSGSQPQPASPAVKSKLNPFAREIKLNINAPSFTPSSKPAAAPSTAVSTSGQDEAPGEFSNIFPHTYSKCHTNTGHMQPMKGFHL